MSKGIKLFDKVVVTVDGERTLLNSMPDLWEWLNWDIHNDENAKQCADMITTELFCFRNCDISPLTNNEHKVIIEWKFNKDLMEV